MVDSLRFGTEILLFFLLFCVQLCKGSNFSLTEGVCFKRRLLQGADGKAVLSEVRFVEDFTPNDFEIRKKALPLMRKAFEEGKRVRFTKGKLFVDGSEVSIM